MKQVTLSDAAERLANFERKYRITSVLMMNRVAEGKMKMTPELEDWLAAIEEYRKAAKRGK